MRAVAGRLSRRWRRSVCYRGGSGRYAYGGGGGKRYHSGGGKQHAHKGDHNKRHFNDGRFRRYNYGWYGGLAYGYYGGGCGSLYRRAVATGAPYWWNRYNSCRYSYY